MNADLIDVAEFFEESRSEDLIYEALNNGAIQGLIIQLNTFGQLGRFEDGAGRKLADIGGEYSPVTSEIKGLGPREVNLNDEGNYWDSKEVEPQRDASFILNSDPFKEGENLEDRWGNELDNLNDENFEKINVAIEEKIIENIENML